MERELTQKMASLETTDGCEDRQQPKIYAKNSMDRFGDDLCQLLLSYLSFGDLFQCESVSKQFRRIVFGSVVCIDINDRFIEQILKTTITETLATIAIKFPKIETIDCRRIWSTENREHIPEVFAIFRDNCLNLRQISCNLWQNSGQTMPTIGPLVTRIDVTDDYIDIQSLTHCHRLSHLNVFDMAQHMKHKKTSLETRDDGNEDNKQQRITKQISDKQCLQSDHLLSHTDSHGFNRKTLDSLGFCHRLKRLELRIYAAGDEIVLDPLRQCKRLTHLELNLLQMTANVLKDLHIKCPRLQYLFIEGSNNFIDTHFKTQLSHISRLPALQTLVIDCNPCTDISNNDFNDLLSRSPKLKTIKANQSSNVWEFYCRQNN
ncbi:unnamed protein product [Medioppia subpectinata]|uniref:F-box domain-containing protein n=1 Tax=Medioppia subpectinata TaxID=1979941 RepID=A0A7R9PVS7_9ACAR|nr:unnamed protein product [Medioppia subpectinata]CAG2102114.1 unnamed protein product [Medioppia subpectinata]